MEDQLAILHGLWGEPDGWSYEGHQVAIEEARFHPKPGRRARPAADADRWRAAAAHRRRRGLAAVVPARGALRGRVQPHRRRARRRPREVSRPSTTACRGDRSRPGDADPLDDGGVLIGRDEAETVDGARPPCSRRSASEPTTARRGSRSGASAGSPARPMRRARRSCGSPRRDRADHAPGLPALGPRHDRRHGRGAGRAV